MRFILTRPLVSVLALPLMFAAAAPCQCSPSWHYAGGFGVELPSGVVAVGDFDGSGPVPLTAAAAWNGNAWSPVGPWPGSPLVHVESGRRSASGELWICGQDHGTGFFMRRWSGLAWVDVPMPVGSPLELCALPSGDMVAACSGTMGATTVVRWNGAAWLNVGSSPPMGFASFTRPYTVEWLPSQGTDALVVGGYEITEMNGCAAQSLLLYRPATGWQGNLEAFSGLRPTLYVSPAGEVIVADGGYWGTTLLGKLGRWNGSAWISVPSPLGSSYVWAMAFDANGRTLLAAQNAVFRSNGVGWSQIGGTLSLATTIVPMPDGSIVIARDGGSAQRWEGTSWQSMNVAPRTIALQPDGQLVGVGIPGAFPHTSRVGRWDGTSWSDLDPAGQINGTIEALALLPTGEIVVGGSFSFANRIARWDGATWQPMGFGFNGNVSRLSALPDGRLVAQGSFTQSGAVLCNKWAIWDGQAWQPLAGAPPSVRSVAAHPNGDLWCLTTARTVSRWATPCPATAFPLGTGCPSSGGANRLLAHGWPLLGSTFRSCRWRRSSRWGRPAVCSMSFPTSRRASTRGMEPV